MIVSLMRWPIHLRPRTPLIRRIEIGVFLFLLGVIAVWAWHHKPSALDQALFKQELRVALVSQPHDRIPVDAGEDADPFELVLLRGLAEQIGARLSLRTVAGPDEAYRLLRARRVDIAAGLLLAPQNEPAIAVGPEILPVRQNLVSWQRTAHDRSPPGTHAASDPERSAPRIGITFPPAAVDDALRLAATGDSNRPVEWIPHTDTLALVAALQQGQIDYAVLISLELSRLRRVHPELRLTAEAAQADAVVWLFSSGFDQSLMQAAQQHLEELRASRAFERLVDRSFGHLEIHDRVDGITFARTLAARLGALRPLFEDVAETYGLDWRFLAAVSYQESLWDPEAVSVTGVRGLMMLTQVTAASLGVTDRTDPFQSVDGGARYVLQMQARLPEDITEPDRTWMALAAYNVGLGHLLDARRLTAADGADPNLWLDVMARLPRLAEREWHEQTRHGYARGWEPVTYVQNIRSYYDWLVQLFPHPEDHSRPSPLYLGIPLTL